MHTTSTLCFTLVLALGACSNDVSPPAGTSSPESSSSAQSIASAAPSASSSSSAAILASAAPSASSSAPEPEPLIVDAGAKHDAGVHRLVDAGTQSTLRAVDAGGATALPTDAGPPPALGTPEAGSADEVAAKIDEVFADKKTFKASFKQEYAIKVSGTTKKSTGTVSVEKPGKISFRYDPPNQNRIVSDGSLLKVYVAEDTQMFTQPVQKTEYPGAFGFIMGHGLRPSFTFTFNDKAKFDGGPVLVGKPRDATPSYESVLFYVDKALLEKKDPGVIRRVLILDAQGNKNRFDFDKVSQPVSIDASEFAFSPPAGTTISQN